MSILSKTKFLIIYFISLSLLVFAQKPTRTDALVSFSNNGAPENIVLTWKGNTATTQAVTWRTDSSVDSGFAEIALADASPDFLQSAIKYLAKTDTLTAETGLKYYHSVNFVNLTPNTLYAYRVGKNEHWSEWFHFRTASAGNEPFSFIYFGDAQNNILSLWSRAIRSAYSEAPKAKFMIHAGDLINRANEDREWREWFDAGDWIHAMVPSIPSPGNHEYSKDDLGNRYLSKFWKPQFTLPENGIAGLEESNYFVDYQNVRIISLNSNEKQAEQTKWLDNLLQNNTQKWVVVTYHHPLYSGGSGRDNKELRDLWKPIFDKHKVDIALQGHDHTYARGRNLLSGINVKDESGGTMYVVSVSGPKMYKINEERWMDRAAQNTQLFQVISVDGDKLNYKAITVTGKVYDEFDLVKQKNKPNLLIDKNPGPPERDFNSRD
ncbi:MAG: metallophosphoesterase family protein [Ignavibacteriae bacterium]|nr:metallophosphoesterase family protein [Ignavibacteriota bacterium]